jgi:hypothetical protein
VKHWYIKRHPRGVSFLHDGFPYLESNLPAGSLWVQTRGEADWFSTLRLARAALKLARRFEPDAFIVRVTHTKRPVPESK